MVKISEKQLRRLCPDTKPLSEVLDEEVLLDAIDNEFIFYLAEKAIHKISSVDNSVHLTEGANPMRTLTAHIINPANDKLTIAVEDEPGQGGACHRYLVSGFNAGTNPGHRPLEGQFEKVILFQNGPIADFGVNGLTHEALLAILQDRLVYFQAGPYACEENRVALEHIESAQAVLLSRTRKRMERGVEGTNIR